MQTTRWRTGFDLFVDASLLLLCPLLLWGVGVHAYHGWACVFAWIAGLIPGDAAVSGLSSNLSGGSLLAFLAAVSVSFTRFGTVGAPE